jgi:hypothetical protein
MRDGLNNRWLELPVWCAPCMKKYLYTPYLRGSRGLGPYVERCHHPSQGSFFRLQNMEGLTLVGLFMEGTTLTCLETYSDAKKRTLPPPPPTA